MSKQSEKGVSRVELVIEKIEQDKAMLSFGSDELITLDRKFLPKEAAEKEALIATFWTKEAEIENKTKKAKEILNEILND